MVKCPVCNGEFEAEPLKTWRFRFYDVKRLQCPKCGGIFNLYSGVSPKGKRSEFTIRVKPRRGKS
jgi:uncharacterized protein (DUF2225 family)